MNIPQRRTTFVAGADGAIGRVLCRLLVQDGWQVVGATRSPARTAELSALGVVPVIFDVCDRDALARAGVKRLMAQSIAFTYAPGPQPHGEDAPLAGVSAPAVARLEELVLGCGLQGLVLSYGRLYGPHTWTPIASGAAPVHVDAAADAARRAMTLGKPGIYNVAEDDGTEVGARAQAEFGWHAGFRAGAGE